MKSYLLCVILLLLLNASLSGQQIRVLDRLQQKGIENVSVYASDRLVAQQTDAQGYVDFAVFRYADTLKFQHPAYLAQALTVEQLRAQAYQVLLTEKIVQLGEAVVMVNRWEQNKQEIPHKIVTLKPAQIAFNNPQTAADALESTGQVFVQKSQLGGGSPMLRGFGANSVLIVVDGIRMNNAIFRGGNLQNVIAIDPAIIGEAEVVFGPGSVIYGSDALGGVMDFHTKQAAFSSEGTTQWSGGGFTRFASANQERTGHIDVAASNARWTSLSSATYSHFGDLRSGNWRPARYPDFGKRQQYVIRTADGDEVRPNENVNLQVPSGYNQWSLMQKFTFRPADPLLFTYGLILSNTSNIPRYDRLIVEEEATGLPENAAWYYGPQRWMLHYLKAELFRNQGLFDAAKVTLGYQAVEESRNSRKFRSDTLLRQQENVTALSLNLDADKRWGKAGQLFYGAELVYNDVRSQAHREGLSGGEQLLAPTRYPGGGTDYHTAALYATHRWYALPTVTLNTGLRYSQVWLTSQFPASAFYAFPYDRIRLRTGALSGSLGLVYRPSGAWQGSAMLSSGFRAPNLDDIGKVFDSEPGSVVVPNPNLSPEYAYNAELNLRRVSDKWEIEVVGFYTWLRNAMVRRDFRFDGQDSIYYDGTLSRVQALVNVGQAYIWGGSFRTVLSLSPHWSAQSSLTYNVGESLPGRVPLRHTTPLFGRTDVMFQHKKYQAAWVVRYHGKRGFENLPPTEQNKPHLYTPEGALAWFTLDLRGSYQLNRFLLLQGGVENLLDKHYRVYASGISAPGRNFLLTLRGTF